MICLRGLALQPKAKAAPCPRVGCGDPPAFTPSRQPEPFVGIVASAEGDLAGSVFCQNPLRHLHRQQGAQREIVKLPGVRELVDDGAAAPQDPELRRGRHTVDVIDTQAQGAELGGAGSAPE